MVSSAGKTGKTPFNEAAPPPGGKFSPKPSPVSIESDAKWIDKPFFHQFILYTFVK